jgi:hypothetical protein
VLLTRSCCCLRRNRTLRFGVLDHPVFLSWGPSVLLVSDAPITATPCVVIFVAKTFSWSQPSRVEVHRRWSPRTIPPYPRWTRRIPHRSVDKTDTPTTQALVAQLESKTLNDSPTDDDPDLLNFTTVESWIACWMSSLLQMC